VINQRGPVQYWQPAQKHVAATTATATATTAAVWKLMHRPATVAVAVAGSLCSRLTVDSLELLLVVTVNRYHWYSPSTYAEQNGHFVLQ
jgi:phage gp16-like protein